MRAHDVNPGADPLFARLWATDLPREHGFEALAVRGEIPDELRGTLLRNGPGLFGLFGTRYRHPFEGDGAITAVRFDGAGATGAVRVTASAGLADERRARRMLYGFSVPWWQRLRNVVGLRMKNTANTSVITWQGRVLALMEAARPTELVTSDPGDVRTVGETDLGGVVRQAFSAHPHRVPARRSMIGFGVEMGRTPRLAVYELPDEGAARRVTRVDLPFAAMVHDFAATARHAVFFVHPLAVELPRLVTTTNGLAGVYRWRDATPSEVIVVPLDAPGDVVRFEVPAFWHWHVASGRDVDGGRIEVDLVRYPDAGSFDAFGDRGGSFAPGTLHRLTVDAKGRTLATRAVCETPLEFPQVHPARAAGAWRTVWGSADGERAIAAIDTNTGAVERHDLPPHLRGGEPIVVPKRDAARETDVWLLVLAYDAQTDRSGVLVLDGARLGDAPVAEAWFDHRIPVTFHGTWAPSST